jgi:hypothetical protein
LLAATGYYIKIAPTAVKDLVGNAYAGIADATTLNFSTTDEDGGIIPTATSGVGYVVSSAGDVNGDGFDDVMVGAPTLRNEPYTGSFLAGGAYVIYGNAAGTLPALPMNTATGFNASITASVGFKISSAISADSKFGATVSGIGDINGDGFDDVMMGGGGTKALAYVVYGGPTNAGVAINSAGNINNSQGFKISLASGFDSTAAFGSVVTGLGDVNGDGVADFGMRINGTYSYVVYGNKTNLSDLVASDQNTYAIDASRGYRVNGLATAVGDMNNDGMADVVATTYNSNDNSSAASIYYSNANGTANTTNVAYSITGTITNSPMKQVTSMGDVNGDGIADLAVLSSRQAFVVYGQTGTTNVALSMLSASQGFKIVLPSGSSHYDWISSAGDVNGDGLADVVMGKQNDYVNFAMVVYGNATGTGVQLSHILGYSSGYNVSDDAIAASQGFKISSPDGVNRIGYRVSNAGDFNGDGLADLIVGGLPTQDGVFGIVLGGTQFVTNAVKGSGTVNGTIGSEALFGSTTNDTLTGGGGVDRFFTGEGNDTIVLAASDVTNLGNVATGQTAKAGVNGGGGFDTIQLSGAANLNLTTISNAGAMGLEENSRIESIERIDLATDTAANTLTLTAKDVNDMAEFNSIHLGGTTATNADGRVWTNVTGTALSATTKFHQLVVDGSASDVVNFTSEAGWTNAGIVNNGTSNYTVWQNTAKNAQILVQSGVTVATPLSLALASDTGTSASDFITKNGTMNVNLSVSTDTWSYSTDSGTTWATGSGTSFVVGAGSYAANAVQVRENGAGGQTVAKLANALTVDMAAPTVAVTLPAGAVNGPKTVTFTFSEAVAGFTNADVSVANGTLSTVTTSNNVVWTATYTPTIGVTAASNVISMASNSYTDVAGNNGAAGQVSFNLDTSLNGATRTSDGAGVGLTGMTNGVWNSVRVYAYYNPLFVDGTVTVYRGATVVGTHTITAGDSGSYTAYLSPYTNSNGGLWTITSGQTGVYSVALTYNGVTKTLPQMYNVGMSTSSNYLSPLVLDLNGDGVQTADISESVVFDLLGTGKKQVTSWVDRHDGFLAIDLNGDGQINSGTELLGSGTQLANGNKAADGWQALTQHDTNMDGHINAADAVFSQLRVWVDANGDSVTDAGELRTMDDVGIVGINLAADDAMVAQNGNYLRGFSSYTTKDGTTHEVVDAWFQTVTTATSVSGNGASEEGEVRSLADTDLAVMNLNSDGVQTIPAAGVTEAGCSTAELSSGLSMLVADVAFDYVNAAPEFVLTGLSVDVLI